MQLFLLYLSSFLLLVSGPLLQASSIDASSESSSERLSFQKPLTMAALDWVQHLEDERDKADQVANFSAFKTIADEISATIAGKYGFSERSATPEEQIAIIHSITRTRHRFMGQRNMLYDRYLGYDRTKTNTLLQTDVLFKDHMAAVLAIDAMVMKAMNDDDFEELWRQENASQTVSADFVSGVVDHAKSYEKKEVFELLEPALQNFLQTRHDAIHLANDIFNIFAPKMTLKKVYTEIMVSGETYRGWTVHNAGTFAQLITLTKEENLLYPGLENELRSAKLGQFVGIRDVLQDDIFPTSLRARAISDEINEKIILGSEEVIVEYIYDECLFEKFGVVGLGVKRFYLSRSVKFASESRLDIILKRKFGVIPTSLLLESRKLSLWGYLNTSDRLEAALERGIAPGMAFYARFLAGGIPGITKNNNPLRALQVAQGAVNLGDKLALEDLPNFLHDYAFWLFKGEDDTTRDIPKAIELCREAASLGNPKAIRNLPRMLAASSHQ